jgi:hypothetical protein
MTTVSIPETDLNTAIHQALREILAPVGHIEALKAKPYLSSKEVQQLYGIPESSLRTFRSRGGGPKFYQPYENGAVTYTHADIQEFMTRNHIRG